jgi:WD40 repeat protein
MAVELAQEAVDGSPNTADYHCTLGVARFRVADWKGAAAAFERSQALRELTPVVDSLFAGDTVDRFFLAMTHWQLGDSQRARSLFVDAAHSMAQNEPANEELRRFRTEAELLLGVRDHRLFQGHSDEVLSVAISGSGIQALSAGRDRTIRRWDLANGGEIACWQGHTDSIWGVEFSPDDRRAISVSHDGTARLWDVESGEELMQFQHAAYVWAAAFSPDGRRVLTGSEHTLHLWDCESGKELAKFQGHVGAVRSVAFSNDGLWAFSGGHDTTVRQWEVASGKEVRLFRGHTHLVLSVAVSPDGRLALSGGCDQMMRLWDIETGEQKSVFEGHYGNLEAVAFAFEGRCAVSGSPDGSIRFWELTTGDELQTIGTAEVLDLAISTDGQDLLSANKDHAVRCWSLPTLHLQLKSPMTADASSP